MNRSGSTVDDGSSRYHTTDAAGASPALSEMKTRPGLVAAPPLPVLPRVRRARQICHPSRPELDEITAGGSKPGGRELRAVCFEERLVASPILSPPDALRAFEDRAGIRGVWIGDERRVEIRALRAGGDWAGDDYPFRRITILEIRIVELPEKRIEPH